MYLFKLKEANMVRSLELGKMYGYMLVSAIRQPAPNASTEDCKEQQVKNSLNSRSLEEIITGNNLSYIPVYGGYQEEGKRASEEKSYFILNYSIKTKDSISFDDFFDLAVNLCQKFNQDSVLVFNPSSGKPAYFDKQGRKVLEFSGNVKFNDLMQMYYTRFSKNKKYDRRFTYEQYTPIYTSVSSIRIAESRGQIRLKLKEGCKEKPVWVNFE